MVKFTIKWKITLLSILSLLVIVAIFSLTVYTALSSWALDREESSTASEAQELAREYESHAPDGSESAGRAPEWIRQYAQPGQAVFVYQGPVLLFAYGSVPGAGIPPAPSSFREELVSFGKHHYVRASAPIQPEQGVSGSVVVYSSADTLLSYISELMRILAASAAGAILLAGLAGYMVAAAALRPVSRLTRSVREIDERNLAQRLPLPVSRDEIAELAETFNGLLARVESAVIRQTRFVADASHELRSPVAVIEGYVNLLDRWGKEDRGVLDKALSAIRKESGVLRRLTNDLLQLASIGSLDVGMEETGETDVAKTARELGEDFSVAYSRRIDVTAPDREVPFPVREEHARQMLTILLHNAVKYTEPERRVEVLVSDEPRGISLSVADEGCGIAPEHLPHLFERFYRVDPARGRKDGGSGLGLAILKELVSLYSGWVSVDSRIGQGTRMSVFLPRNARNPARNPV